ncbi:MAG: response regulator transcription factor [Spirochaetales bacterium]|jgi:DNA-binding response OmpR family regulator|nr:response regulator transcription factor [Spirochaetales bacterium]
MRVLIVEDDQKIAGFVTKGLREAGFAVDAVKTGEDGLSYLLSGSYDAAIADIMLPGMDGLEMISRLRDNRVLTPILILSARHSVDDRVLGFQKGGDDYLTKPFSFAELLVRIQALIRRAGAQQAAPVRLQFEDLAMDPLRREVTRSGQRIDLQPREYALLEYFMRHPGQVLSKTMILEHIWDYDFDPQTNVVDVLVFRLRNKIEKEGTAKLLHTLRGVGYVLRKE